MCRCWGWWRICPTSRCPHCGGRTDIFGHGGAAAEAARIGVKFLGEVPLLLEIRETGDGGPVLLGTSAAATRSVPWRGR